MDVNQFAIQFFSGGAQQRADKNWRWHARAGHLLHAHILSPRGREAPTQRGRSIPPARGEWRSTPDKDSHQNRSPHLVSTAHVHDFQLRQ